MADPDDFIPWESADHEIDLRDGVAAREETSGSEDEPEVRMYRLDALLELSELAANQSERPSWTRFH